MGLNFQFPSTLRLWHQLIDGRKIFSKDQNKQVESATVSLNSVSHLLIFPSSATPETVGSNSDRSAYGSE